MKKEKEVMTAEQLLVSEYLQMKEELNDLRERNENLTSSIKYLLDRNLQLRKAINALEPYRTESGLISFHKGLCLSKYDEGFKLFDEYLRKNEEEEKASKGTEKLLKAIFKEDKEEENKEESEEKKENE